MLAYTGSQQTPHYHENNILFGWVGLMCILFCFPQISVPLDEKKKKTTFM